MLFKISKGFAKPAVRIADIPILIPSFNNPSYCRMMVDQLLALGQRHIIVIDNASTSPSMLRLLEELAPKVRVIRLGGNKGPKYFARNWLFYLRLPPVFCVTDPDIQFNPNLPANFLETLLTLTQQYRIGKAGFALKIQDHHDFRDITVTFNGKSHDIVSWESQFWQEQLGHTACGQPIYRADIDTTFALYNKAFFTRKKAGFYRALRVAGDFTARHLPWYRASVIDTAEEQAYAASQKFSWYARP